MKKYMPVLLFTALFITLLGFNVGSTSAEENSNQGDGNNSNSGCRAGDIFSRTTGERCVASKPACRPGDKFDSTTGQPCGDTIPKSCRALKEFKIGSRGDDVKELQQTLREEGLFSGKVDGVYGQVTNGARLGHYRKCPMSIITVVSPNGGEGMVQGQYSTIRWLTKNIPSNATMNIYVVNSLSIDNSPTGQIAAGLNPNEGPFNKQLFVWKSTGTDLDGEILPSGKYKIDLEVTYSVPVTADNQKGIVVVKDLSDNYFTITSPTTETPSINVVSPNGGETFALGGTIAGSFTTTKPLGTYCDVAIVRSLSGTETVVDRQIDEVRVTSSSKQEFKGIVPSDIPVSSSYRVRVICSTDANDFVQDQSDRNFTVTSKVTNTPSITVLSPNGGEAWVKGATQTIKWKNNTITPPDCPSGAYCMNSAPKYYDVKLTQVGAHHCTIDACTNGQSAMYTVAEDVYGSSYEWSVGKSTTGLVPDGSYLIQVCQTGTDTCDSSNSSFRITSSSTYLPGCTSVYGFSTTTGRACDGTDRQPTDEPTPPPSLYPTGCTSNRGFSTTTGASCGTSTPEPCPAGTTPVGTTSSIPPRYICASNNN